jgi:hypothetical protein
MVLSFLRENKSYGKLSKCSFFHKEIHYLGHIISGEGISVDPEKVEAIMGWPVPKNAHEVRNFMGLAGYYRRFVEGFSKIAKPITTLQRKGVRYDWTEECDSAFTELKRLLTSAPILRVPDMEIVESVWRFALWWNLLFFLLKRKCVYMNIHNYVTKPQLSK